MLAAVAGAAIQQNREFVFYIVVMVVLIAVIAFVNWRAQLPNGILWGLSIWGLLHMAGGLIPLPEGWPYHGENAVLYSWWILPELLKYDQIIHAYGFGLMTILCWDALRTGVQRADGVELRPTLGLMTLCAAAGVGFGALNEVIEFIAVLTIPNTNVGGYDNTGWDLVANLVGAITAVVLIRMRRGSGLSRPG
ncbi:MAG: putative membrane protein YjdF [Verrucomicrobiales bacterium]|jgi:uncharacterized membrane protein YjdF